MGQKNMIYIIGNLNIYGNILRNMKWNDNVIVSLNQREINDSISTKYFPGVWGIFYGKEGLRAIFKTSAWNV